MNSFSKKDHAPLKRFLTLSSDELRDKYPIVLETLCQELVPRRRHRSSPKSEKLLVELIRQPSLLTPAIFARGLLGRDSEFYRVQFIKYGWREAVEEGLREEYPGGGSRLWWDVMEREFSRRSHPEYPPSEEVRTAVLGHFKTKQELENAWTRRNAPSFQEKLQHQLELLLSETIARVIVEYAATSATWLDVEDAVLPLPRNDSDSDSDRGSGNGSDRSYDRRSFDGDFDPDSRDVLLSTEQLIS